MPFNTCTLGFSRYHFDKTQKILCSKSRKFVFCRNEHKTTDRYPPRLEFVYFKICFDFRFFFLHFPRLPKQTSIIFDCVWLGTITDDEIVQRENIEFFFFAEEGNCPKN